MSIQSSHIVSLRQRISRLDLLLLVVLTLLWGANWPVMKDAVSELPPLFFRAISMLGGVAALGAWIVYRGLSFRIPAGRSGDVVLLAIPNMLIWHLFAIYGISLLSSGRAAILGYTMPLWAALAARGLLREKIQPHLWLGLGIGGLGIALLLSSAWHGIVQQPIGMLFMLIAACGWGVGTVLIRKLAVPMETTVLTWWMLLITTPCLWLGSVWLEYTYWVWPNSREWLEIAYNAILVFAVCHVIWFRLASTLPPAMSSLSVLLIPVVGVFTSIWWLGEKPQWQDFVALLLLLSALAIVLLRCPVKAEASKIENLG